MDDLRKAPNPEAKLTLHPSLQEVGDEMEAYDYHSLEKYNYEITLDHTLAMAVRSLQESAESVKVHKQSLQGKSPLALQCRALGPFKRKQLMLVPGGRECQLIMNN